MDSNNNKNWLSNVRIIFFEKHITSREKINAEQAELENKIEKMKDEPKETSDKILNKNKDLENKANYLEMKINSSNIISSILFKIIIFT